MRKKWMLFLLITGCAAIFTACGITGNKKDTGDLTVESHWEQKDYASDNVGEESGNVTVESNWETSGKEDRGPGDFWKRFTGGDAPGAVENAQEETLTNDPRLNVMISGVPVSVQWEDNDAVRGLSEQAAKNTLRIEMTGFGGFEQVGTIGTRLSRDDREMTAQPGDIVLYAGNRIVVFCGSNTWAYTPLGRITGMSQQELNELLGTAGVTMEISAG